MNVKIREKQRKSNNTSSFRSPNRTWQTLVPPFQALLDTNFINFSVRNKIDIKQGITACLDAKCIIYVTDCVKAELELLGQNYNVSLKIAKDPRFERLPCLHKGTYADDCLFKRASDHRCYIVATCDRELQRRIRNIPGVPILYVKSRKYKVERFIGN